MTMFWADELLKNKRSFSTNKRSFSTNQKGKEVVNDSFTPSGIVHMGSLKGPVIHDSLFRILKEQGNDVKFLYGLDDLDPIDGLPEDLKKTHEKYMGIPISEAPSPDGKGSFGEYYGNKMLALLHLLGINAEFYKTSELYKKGEFDPAIKLVLDNAQKVRDVYGRIYKKQITQDWFPLQVICPDCGKLGTTKVISWDGEEVTYECSKTLVKWAEGCGKKGKTSPFGGRAKMPWKVEWAAKWWTFGVTIEGAGKDHASAGGSYDVAMQLVKDVFASSQPLKLAYEFFLVGGKKMSSSKGIGLTGEELLEVLTPQVARFLMVRTRPEQAVEFDPYNKDIIPRLYDDYQKAAGKEDDNHNAFKLSQIGETEKIPTLRFLALTQLVQMPNKNGEIKKEGAESWAPCAKKWVEKYAPDDDKFIIQEKLPEEARNLTDLQKQYLSSVANLLDKTNNAEAFQVDVYNLAKELGLPSKEAFQAIYLSLLGKDHGPKAAWLILSLDKDFVKERFNVVSK